ncbi:ribonuclease H-like domain-containing protein [Tanacetum coccineum]
MCPLEPNFLAPPLLASHHTTPPLHFASFGISPFKEESHRGSSSATGNKHHASAFAARSFNEINNNGHKNNSKKNVKNPNLICSNPNCGLTGHTVDKCYKIVGYPDHIKKKWENQKTSNNNASIEVPTSTATSKPCSAPSLLAEQIHQLLNLLNSSKISNNAHAYMGVHKLAKDSKLFIGFDEHKCYIQYLEVQKTLGTGSQRECLLGHPSDQVLKALKHKIDIKGNCNSSLYDIRHYSKQTREPFPLSEHKTTFVGDLIHLDVWGPYKITSKEGFKYFLTIVDDYSRAIWGGVPLNMWTECILTATYLINRLPTYVLKGKSPYDFVPYFKHTPDPLPNDDSEAQNHGSENRSPHVYGTEIVDSDNTSISNSEATHDEDGIEPLNNVHT